MRPMVRLALASLFLSLSAPWAAAQLTKPSTRIQLIEPNGRPLPRDFFVVRDARGREIHARRGQDGGFAFFGVGRKVSLEFTRKGLKTPGIELVLEDAPLVWVEVVVDPHTGRVKDVRQKALRPDIGTRSLDNGRDLGPGAGRPAAPSAPVDFARSGKTTNLLGQPSNDDCGNAFPIGNGATAFSTLDATTDGAPDPGGQFDGQTYEDVWYLYDATCTGTLSVSTCGAADYDTDLVLYAADADGNGVHDLADCALIVAGGVAPLDSNDDFGLCGGATSRVSAPVVAGRQYLVRVGGGQAGDRGAGTLTVSCELAPAGDSCGTARVLECGVPLEVNSVAATTGMFDPEIQCAFGGPTQGLGSLWFSFTATSASARLTTDGSTAVSDTMLAVYDGNCGNLVELACDDDGGEGLLSSVCVSGLVVGEEYLVQVASYPGTEVGPLRVSLECPGPCFVEADDLLAALEIPCGGEVTIDNSNAGTDPLDPLFSCALFGPQQGAGTLWFSFVATDSAARVTTNGSEALDTLLAVYSGTPGAFTELGCSDDDGNGLHSEVCVSGLTVGQRYWVQAASFDDFSRGPITVSVQCPCELVVSNDVCDNAVPLSVPSSTLVDLTGSTDDVDQPCEIVSGPFQNVWYRVTGTGNVLTASTCNAGTLVPDTKIAVYCLDCGARVCVAGNDDNCPVGGPIFASRVSWCTQAGAQYLVTVGTFSPMGAVGIVQLDLSEGGPCEADVQCFPTGACCLADGTCVTETAEACRAMGGVYQGDDTDCAMEFVADGGFEAGTPSGSWTEFSTSFGTPLCDSACGSGGSVEPPRSGDWWAWFGGSNVFEEASLEQSVTIPTDATSLDLFLKIPVSSGNGSDFIRVLIDGLEQFVAMESDAVFAGDVYLPVSIPLAGFNDGFMHTLRIEAVTVGPEITNFFVDDVSISALTFDCPECMTLDFETEDDFFTPLGNGQSISTPPEFGNLVAISAAGANAGAAIFDSTPGLSNDFSQDKDLLVGRGNLLILQNSLVPGETGGFYDRPNDDQDGGDLFFDFVSPVTPTSIVLVDIDVGTAQASSVTLVDSSFRTRTYTVPCEWTEDILINGGSGWRTLDLTTLAPQPGFASVATASEQPGFDPTQVMTIQVHLGSSGAVDDLEFCR